MSQTTEITALIRKRGSLKSMLTRFSNFFKSVKELEDPCATLLQLEVRLAKIESHLLTDFNEIQLQIETQDPNFDSSETADFEDTYFSIVAEAKEFILSRTQVQEPERPQINSSSGRFSNSQVNIKLPTIELPKFSGVSDRWLEFKDLFTSLIHNCDQIGEIQKFHYLRASLEGAAAQCIKSIEFSAENYQIAWNVICERFNNKRLMVHNHIKSLFSITEIKSGSPSAFRDLVDTISKNMRSLECLGLNVESWDPIIIHLITSKLDTDALKEWEQQDFEDELPTLEEFKFFLSRHADVLEKLNMHKCKPKNKETQRINHKSFVASCGTGGDIKNKFACFICKKPHSLYKCDEFLSLPVSQRKERVISLNLCLNCLHRGHQVQTCKYGKCKHCNKKHNSLLHPTGNASSSNASSGSIQGSVSEQQQQIQGSVSEQRQPIQGSMAQQERSDQTEVSKAYCNYSSAGQVLLATALIEVFDVQGKGHMCRALLDNASMSNFITEKLAIELGISLVDVNHSIIGIGQTQTTLRKSCDIQFRSLQYDYTANLCCLVIPQITDDLPSRYFDPASLEIPSHIKLADPQFNCPSRVDLLIGAEAFWSLMRKGTIHLGNNRPLLQKSTLGWFISGPLYTPSLKVNSCHFSRNVEIQDQLSKFWEIEEVTAKQFWSSEESAAEQHFCQTYRRDSDGRFIVSIPLKHPAARLGDSKQVARRQFLNLEKRLASNDKLRKMYSNFITEYQQLGHMSHYISAGDRPTFYSPHHGVLREESATTKLRVVFNASTLSSSGISYNDIQMVGPIVQDNLQSILLRFRQHAYVFSADICKMYRQVQVDEEFRPLQLILWRSNPEDELQTYSLNTVTYGTASAPFLATRCIKQLAIDHESSNPVASQVIGRDFYVDDLLSGSNSVSEAIEICQQISNILKSGCFELRKWKSNNQDILRGIKALASKGEVLHFAGSESSKILGMLWSCTEDTFSFQIDMPLNVKRVTKRIILSETARIFDAIGLLGPVIITAKIMIQTLWQLHVTWDQEVPDKLSQKWLTFRSELSKLNSLQIPRHISCKRPVQTELHGFSDASQRAFGACIYVRTVDADHNVHVHLLTSKTRVAPLKSISIPRLELCAALLLARLLEQVTGALTLTYHKEFLWSDSTVVLAWIRSSPHILQTFVGNRVTEIQRLTDIQSWRYVPTNSNPADMLSRGMSPERLVESKTWFSGPSWLTQSSTQWPVDISIQNPISVHEMPEVRRQVQTFVQVEQNQLFPFSRFSSLHRLKRAFAYCLRFIRNCRAMAGQRQVDGLTLEELRQSMETLVQLSQRESFPREYQEFSSSGVTNKGKLVSLTPFLENGVIRVGGRLKHSSYSFEKKHPAVLSPNHHLTKLIFRHYHIEFLHCGPQALLSYIRESYWPISGKNLAKRIVRECIACFRFKPQVPSPIMGNLPEPRVSPQPPFMNTGVDYAGPFMIRDRKGRGCKPQKCYLCIFICLATKAVHLELVTGLSTPAFLETFQRFLARRGKPSHVYSDNGSNFVGANNELKEIGNFIKSNRITLIEQLELKHDVKWHFIAAYSPHQGGLWEAGVKSAKHHIKRVISNALLTFESFYTIITQIESILNCRPLTPLSTDPNDFEVLTPAHFLIGRSLQTIPYPDLQNLPSNRLSHFEQLEKLKQHFWSRWSREYISQLQQRTKWKTNQPNITIGTMVLVQDNNLPPFMWRLGRIVAVHPGDDKVVRVVSVKTKSGVIKRAVVKVCPLPIDTVGSDPN